MHVAEVTPVALEGDQESISISGLHEPDVGVICHQFFSILVVQLLDWERDGPGVTVATGTPTTLTWKVRRPTRGKVGAKDSFGKADGLRAAFLLAVACQIGHICQLSIGKQACGARKEATQR